MFVHVPWYSRSTTSQRPASSTTTFGFSWLIALSHWFGQGSLAARPAGLDARSTAGPGVS